ncbi:flagellar hook-length control protein FliK [uncultured Campylobacter sp.]|uniref:flagellar hook-length control protein FliK n=1 Tax=uncultured Campylobacter sp. TaxID=218934 RepID=UPI0028E939A5|nr:flagellar hook-length control protein FliK [uncultured Campylobacter sp.]
MQTTQNDILSFDASIKGGVKKQSKNAQKGGKEDGVFLSMVLDAAAKKGENLSEKDLKEMAKAVNLSAQTAQNGQIKAPIQSTDVKEILGEEAAENLFENATFMQLLQILEMLSGGEKISKFPNFENRLAKALSSETTLNELRGAKNLNELIEIANKLNLGLENIEVTQAQADELGEKFPSLAKKDFFEPVTPKKNFAFSELKNKVEEAINANEPEPKDTLNKLLAAVQEEQNKAQPKDANTKAQDTQNLAQNSKIIKEAVKNEDEKEVNLKDEKPNLKAESELNLTAVKSEKSGLGQDSKKINLQNLLFPERESVEEQVLTEPQSDGSENSELNAMVKDVISNAKAQTRNFQAVRETLDNFSSNLKEQVAAYKSPFMRFNITLNPLNLGEVEITMVNRGNNLHINFSSNTQTMNLFLQNQAEFKNSLVNMGFTELEMNFSDQNQQKKEQGQKSYKGSKFNADGTEQVEAAAPRLELVVPRYV